MSSAADVKEGTGGNSNAGEPLGTLGSARSACLAKEIPVNATGTRPGTGPDKRELFTEESCTVLIFPDGAVIRLSAAVATGQLIFLTNKQTNKEVVSQVVGKRVYKPTSCYVELKFTEEIAGFWGVEFPATAPEKPQTRVAAAQKDKPRTGATENADVAELSVAEQVESAETTEDSGASGAVAPTGKEVEELRGEVEALRRQLEELKKAEVAAKVGANMALPGERAPASQDTVAPIAESRRETLASVNEQTPITPVVLVAPVVAAPVEARKSHVGMSLPNRAPAKIDPEQEVIDQLLPQPELDFSKAPIPPKRGDWDDPYSIYKPARAKIGKQVLVLLVLVLIGAAGAGALKLGLLGRLTASAKKSSPVEGQVKKGPVPPKTGEGSKATGAPNATAVPGETGPVANRPTAVASTTNSNGAVAQEIAPMKPEANSAGPIKPEASADRGVPAADAGSKVAATTAPAVKAAKRETSAAKNKSSAPAKKKAAVKESREIAPAEIPVAEDAPVLPAKLLRWVSPEYPPDAMRNFITGDVKLKAEVDEKGHIRSVEVVSGPKALRESAIEAFKQYEYAPATKGGKGVTSQVNVTIKFWFVP